MAKTVTSAVLFHGHGDPWFMGMGTLVGRLAAGEVWAWGPLVMGMGTLIVGWWPGIAISKSRGFAPIGYLYKNKQKTPDILKMSYIGCCGPGK